MNRFEYLDPEKAALLNDHKKSLDWMMHSWVATPLVVSRARYTEDILLKVVHHGLDQYVILGAGIDTFPFRGSNILKKLKIFEIDHPATQAFKCNRLAELGWKLPPQLNFIPLDFTKDSLEIVLKNSSYVTQDLSFFSWLGVTYYLSRDVVFDTMQNITNIAPPGSSIIFDYFDTDAYVPEKASERVLKQIEFLSSQNEPLKTGFEPSKLGVELENIGLHLCENLSPYDIQKRYFQGRTDGLHAWEHAHIAWAVVN
ncbi:MAG: SAM-dependent methyltransferase [Methanobacterium sp.]